MSNDRMGSALAALALALIVLVSLEIVWDDTPLLSANFRKTHFLDGPGEQASPEEKGEIAPLTAEKPGPGSRPLHTTRDQVRALFAGMKDGSRKSLRIAYYADSITEGDVITEVLRRDLQGIYGGTGVGFQGIAPRDATFRVSLTHRPSKDWKRLDLHDWKKDHALPLGINGEAYRLDAASPSGTLRLEQIGTGGEPWYERATLYWGKGALGLDAGGRHFDLKGDTGFNAFPIPVSPQAKLLLRISADPQTLVYGVGLDSPTGVGVDNYSFRGNSGDGLANLSPEMLQLGQGALNYDLVILHFGINALQKGETDFQWYRGAMRNSFEHLKNNLPGAKIVVVSVMDHAQRRDGEIVSDPSVPYLIAAQEAAARDSGLWFINLYDMTGGKGVMKSWVEAAQPLANKDYTHPNRRGGARLAKYLESALLGEKAPLFAREDHAP